MIGPVLKVSHTEPQSHRATEKKFTTKGTKNTESKKSFAPEGAEQILSSCLSFVNFVFFVVKLFLRDSVPLCEILSSECAQTAVDGEGLPRDVGAFLRQQK